MTIRITFDTNALTEDTLISMCEALGWHLAVVSVTEREVDGTPFEVCLQPLGTIRETAAFYGEGGYGQGLWPSEESKKHVEEILQVISSGGFPTERSNLTDGQEHQKRDAMILEAHIREGREIFVTRDEKGFINHGRRERLQETFGTRVLTPEEFGCFCRRCMATDARDDEAAA